MTFLVLVGGRLGRPDVAPRADARLRPRPRRRPGRHRGAAAVAARAELWHLVVLSALYGALEAFFRPAAGGLIPALVPPGELQQANALIGARAERRPRARPGRGRRADRRAQPGRGARRRRRDVRRQRRLPARAARARARDRTRPATSPHFWRELKGGRGRGPARAAGCSASCPRSRPTTSSRCRACWRSARCWPTRSSAARARGR